MAVFTRLSPEDADRVCLAHGIGPCRHVQPIPQGSVNSNFFVTGSRARYFLRVYEEQDPSGVAYEWALLDHLRAHGVPVPRRVGNVEPGAVRVAGKPVALFEVVEGTQSCQASVEVSRTLTVGSMLGDVHRAGSHFGWQKEGRFELEQVVRRLDDIDYAQHPELVDCARELRDTASEVQRDWPSEGPRGLMHGDLFRDNVMWDGERIIAVIDWESASHGLLGYDLMVTVLAWCYDDAFRWDLAGSLVSAYLKRNPMDPAALGGLRVLGLAAASRFTITRITDFHLREGIGERVHKDYQRFLARLRTLRSLTAQELIDRLSSSV